MKSGEMPMASIASQIDRNSVRAPTHNLNPTGLPPDDARSVVRNCTNSVGVENAVCAGGDTTVRPTRSRVSRSNGDASVLDSMKYCRISGRMSSITNRTWPRIGYNRRIVCRVCSRSHVPSAASPASTTAGNAHQLCRTTAKPTVTAAATQHPATISGRTISA